MTAQGKSVRVACVDVREELNRSAIKLVGPELEANHVLGIHPGCANTSSAACTKAAPLDFSVRTHTPLFSLTGFLHVPVPASSLKTCKRSAAQEIGQGAIGIQIDVTDRVSIAEAAERIHKEFGRLDLLVNNAAISNTRKRNLLLQDYAKISQASNASLDEIRAVWGPMCSVLLRCVRLCSHCFASRPTPAS